MVENPCSAKFVCIIRKVLWKWPFSCLLIHILCYLNYACVVCTCFTPSWLFLTAFLTISVASIITSMYMTYKILIWNVFSVIMPLFIMFNYVSCKFQSWWWSHMFFLQHSTKACSVPHRITRIIHWSFVQFSKIVLFYFHIDMLLLFDKAYNQGIVFCKRVLVSSN